MNAGSHSGTALWWSFRRAVRLYGALRAASAPIALGLAVLLVRVAAARYPNLCRLCLPAGAGALAVVAASLAGWRVISDRSSGFAEGLAWCGVGKRMWLVCTLAAFAILFAAQAGVLVGVAALASRQGR